MKKGWQTSTLGEVLAVLRNGLNCKQDKSGRGDKISRIESISAATFNLEKVGYADLSDREKEQYRLQPGDILFSHINSAVHVGKTALFASSEPIYHGVNLLLLRPKDAITSAYLDYVLKYLFQRGYWRGVCKQSVNQASVNQKDISQVQISYPHSLPEQQRIVAILDEAFAGIATAVANTEKNLANARELFDSYLNNVFTQKGEGWVEKKLGDVCVLKSGTTVSKDLEISSGEVPYLKVADMNHAGNEIEIVGSSRFLNKSDLGRNAIFPIGTTIFPKRGGAILTNKKRLTAVPICTDLNIMGVIPSGALVPKFLYFYFLNVDMRKLGSGSSIPQINNYDIEPLAISFPQVIAEQKEIAKTLEELSSETHHLQSLYQHKRTTLAALKQSILHKAFSGALTSQSVSTLQEAVA